jgi:hypothetical protein
MKTAAKSVLPDIGLVFLPFGISVASSKNSEVRFILDEAIRRPDKATLKRWH